MEVANPHEDAPLTVPRDVLCALLADIECIYEKHGWRRSPRMEAAALALGWHDAPRTVQEQGEQK